MAVPSRWRVVDSPFRVTCVKFCAFAILPQRPAHLHQTRLSPPFPRKQFAQPACAQANPTTKHSLRAHSQIPTIFSHNRRSGGSPQNEPFCPQMICEHRNDISLHSFVNELRSFAFLAQSNHAFPGRPRLPISMQTRVGMRPASLAFSKSGAYFDFFLSCAAAMFCSNGTVNSTMVTW